MKQCFIFMLCFLGTFQTDAVFTTFTAFNKTLTGFAYKTIKNVDWLNCINACHQENSCVSYNFWRTTELSGMCELNHCGFENACSADVMLIWVPGCTFQQLATTKDTKSRCESSGQHAKSKTELVNASFSCMDEMSVYTDGKLLIDTFNCTKTRPLAVNFTIPRSTEVVAIETESSKRPSIIGSFSDGVVTDSNWKCTSNTFVKWKLPDFDDASWKQAKISEESDDGGTAAGQVIGPLPQAKWIVPAEGGVQIMYCRLHRDKARP